MNIHLEKKTRSKDRKSKHYTPPRSVLTVVRMEMGIAASSTTVTPTNSGNRVQEEFDMQEQERGIVW